MTGARVMPRTAVEAWVGRPLALAAFIGSGLLAAASIVGVAVMLSTEDVVGHFGAVTLIIVSVPVLWCVITVFLGVLLLGRPKQPVLQPMRDRTGTMVTGSRAIPAASFLSAVTFTLFSAECAAITPVGWSAFCWILAALFTVAAVSTAFGLARKRRLILTPTTLRSSSYLFDTEIAWSDIVDIRYAEGMGGIVVVRVSAAADRIITHSRHPFARRRTDVDVEPVALGLDGTLLLLALHVYRDVPASRAELAFASAPSRLTDADIAIQITPPQISVPVLLSFRPEAHRHL